jgi:hypothetical protein
MFFSRLIKLFTRSNSQEKKAEKQLIPGTELSFDPELISSLKSDHIRLLEIYSSISVLLDEGKADELAQPLEEFKALLREHLLTENLKLYVYLKYALVNDAKNLNIMIELRKDMQKIGKVVNQFLTRYSEFPWTDELKSSFPDEFYEIGSVLGERIEREEALLYTLYMPPDAY